MSNQFLKLRRSAVPGKVPTTSSIDFGEIALNTYDGLAFIKKSGSNGEEIVAIGSTVGSFTGSFSGSFTGNLQGTASCAINALTASYVANIPIIDNSRIVTGSITASVGVEFEKAFKVENSIADPSGNTTLLLINQSGSIAINTSSFDALNPETLLIVSHDDTTYNLIVGRSDTDNYSQFNIKNQSSGSLASSDIVATNDIGNEDDYYVDLGINSSTYNNPFFVGNANDAYLYSKANDFFIGTAKPDTKVVIFGGGPDAEANAKIYIHPQGVIGINTNTTSSITSPALPALRIVASPSAPDTYNLLQAESNVDTYSQILIQNLSSGTSASADIVAENDLGTESGYYVDMGINSSTHIVDPSYTVGGPNDTYLLSTGRNHYIGSATTGSLTFFTNNNFDGEAGAKLILRYNNRHEITGSLNAPDITGSLFGTASWALSSSYSPNIYNSDGTLTGNRTITSNGYYLTFDGSLGIGSTALSKTSLSVGKKIVGPLGAFGIAQTGEVQSNVFSAFGYLNSIATQATNFTLAAYFHYAAQPGVIGVGSTVTSQYGFYAAYGLYDATNNYGFYGDIPNIVNNSWNLYMAGSAPNYLAGRLAIGTTTTSSAVLTVQGNVFASSFTGSLFGTASWALNSLTASSAVSAISSSYPIAVTGSTLYSFNAGVPSGFATQDSIFLGTRAGSGSLPSYYNVSTIAIGDYAGYLASIELTNAIGSSAGYSSSLYVSNAIGNNAAKNSRNSEYTNFIGTAAGQNSRNILSSNIIGINAGDGSSFADSSNFIGTGAGRLSETSSYSNFIGLDAGAQTSKAQYSNFFGYEAGRYTIASHSIFIGYNAGTSATNANSATFLGYQSGKSQQSSSFSTIIGYNTANTAFISNQLSSNNIIIGTNITLGTGRKDSINLGGLIFGTGSYATTTGNPFSGSAMGRVGINQPLPEFNLDVSGSGRYTNGLQVTGSLIAPSITGSLFGTASWALNSLTASIATNALTASFGGNFTASNALINGTLTAQTLVVQTVTSSILYSSGSNIFGNQLTNTQQFTGSVTITGSLNVNGNSVVTSNQTGSMSVATASFATSASYAINAVSSSYPIAVTGSTIYSFNAGIPSGNATVQSIFLGTEAGAASPSHRYSNVLGYYAAYSSSNAAYSNVLGYYAGYSASGYADSNIIGSEAGYSAKNLDVVNLIGQKAGYESSDVTEGIFIGPWTGYRSKNTVYTVFMGSYPGWEANDLYGSNFIGFTAGYRATLSEFSNFIGYEAGQTAYSSSNSNFIGREAGYFANNASQSNFIGYLAGSSARNAHNSNFIGYGAGRYAMSASYSTLIGYNVAAINNRSVGSNNIIIGTNVTLENQRRDSINLGGLIFGTGSYSTTTGNPFSGSANGRIGINQPLPEFNLDVSGSGRYTTGLTVTGSLIAPSITGSLQGTASWATNFITSSVTSASFAATASYATNVFDIGIAEFNTTSSLTSAGTTIVSSINTGSFTSAFYNYTIASGSNARAGQVMSVWSGSTVRYTEVTTTDIGNTATASFAVAISGPTVQLSFTAPGIWRVKSIANLL